MVVTVSAFVGFKSPVKFLIVKTVRMSTYKRILRDVRETRKPMLAYFKAPHLLLASAKVRDSDSERRRNIFRTWLSCES